MQTQALILHPLESFANKIRHREINFRIRLYPIFTRFNLSYHKVNDFKNDSPYKIYGSAQSHALRAVLFDTVFSPDKIDKAYAIAYIGELNRQDLGIPLMTIAHMGFINFEDDARRMERALENLSRGVKELSFELHEITAKLSYSKAYDILPSKSELQHEKFIKEQNKLRQRFHGRKR